MVSSAHTTIDQYLAALPPDRRAEIARVRSVVNAKLPRGYEEGMLYGMIGWYIPLASYSDTYNGQPLCLAGLAAQKQHLALYMMTVYGDPKVEQKFKAGFKAAGKKLDMGKSCVRFKTADALALDVIGETISQVTPASYIAAYEKARGARAKKPAAKPTKKKAPAKKSAAKR
ncbi:MAG: DUF1801 domain-containing protein [Deltaproteobacteria bacterium]|nr:DUF1801 domain-containing protein [Deltaproteobacteria bacterium]